MNNLPLEDEIYGGQAVELGEEDEDLVREGHIPDKFLPADEKVEKTTLDARMAFQVFSSRASAPDGNASAGVPPSSHRVSLDERYHRLMNELRTLESDVTLASETAEHRSHETLFGLPSADDLEKARAMASQAEQARCRLAAAMETLVAREAARGVTSQLSALRIDSHPLRPSGTLATGVDEPKSFSFRTVDPVVLASLDARLARLERVIGEGGDRSTPLVEDLRTIRDQMESLGSVDALRAKIKDLSPLTEDAVHVARVQNLAGQAARWESELAAVPVLLGRLQTLQRTHADLSRLAASVDELRRQQQDILVAVREDEKLLRSLEPLFDSNLKAIEDQLSSVVKS